MMLEFRVTYCLDAMEHIMKLGRGSVSFGGNSCTTFSQSASVTEKLTYRSFTDVFFYCPAMSYITVADRRKEGHSNFGFHCTASVSFNNSCGYSKTACTLTQTHSHSCSLDASHAFGGCLLRMYPPAQLSDSVFMSSSQTNIKAAANPGRANSQRQKQVVSPT